MTTYNCADYVEETMISILAQTFTDFEFLIIDDGSSDDTCARIRQFDDRRIRLYSEPDNQGVGARLNQALSLIRTPYIAKVDADDISLPHRFSQQLQFLQKHPQFGIAKSYFEYFTDDPLVAQSDRFRQFRSVKEAEHNCVNQPDDIAQQLRRWNCVIHTSYFAKTDVVKQIGYVKSRVGEDYSLFYKAAKAGVIIGCVPEVLVRMRLSQNSVTTKPDSAFHFAQALTALKYDELSALAKRHGSLWLYGTGGLAKGMAKAFAEHGIVLAGFIDRQAGSLILEDGEDYRVLPLTTDLARGLVIAAQPVRAEILQFFLDAGWQEWADFMVIA
ncbi:glycosyltransferase family 2 protein [Methylotuvimicrobium alcaliphilum]|nr:glycosyltransferase [Methylotuvimicrobium alcaliphilum]